MEKIDYIDLSQDTQNRGGYLQNGDKISWPPFLYTPVCLISKNVASAVRRSPPTGKHLLFNLVKLNVMGRRY
jgi:hypothetical protein